MNDQEIIVRNKEIAKMLGWVYVSFNDVKEETYHKSVIAGWYRKFPRAYHPKVSFKVSSYVGRSHHDLSFDSNWNELMQVKHFITNLGYRWYYHSDEQNETICITDMTIKQQSHVFGGGDIVLLRVFNNKSPLNATFVTISDFAKQYNESNNK